MTNGLSAQVWINLQMSRGGDLILWRGADAIGISFDYAESELLPQIDLGEAAAALLGNGDIVPVRAPRALINDLWAMANEGQEEEGSASE